MGITCKIIDDYGLIAKSDKAEMRLKQISWNGEEPKMDIRVWVDSNKARGGVTMSMDELKKLGELIEQVRNSSDTEESEDVDVDDIFESDNLPINKPVEDDEPQAEEEPKEKPKATKKVTKVEKPKAEEKPIEKAKTNTNYTYKDCEKKLDKLFEKVAKYPNFEYVLTGLKELARVDNEFIQNAMRESRTFSGMMGYAKNGSKKYCEVVEGGTCITDDQMLELCIEYFSAKEEPKKETKTTTKSVSKNTTKTTTKKTTTSKKSTTKAKKTKPVENDEDFELPFN